MNKQILIRLSILAVMVLVLVNAPELIGQNLYQAIMIAVGCWQVGTWCAKLGDYLVRKYCD